MQFPVFTATTAQDVILIKNSTSREVRATIYCEGTAGGGSIHAGSNVVNIGFPGPQAGVIVIPGGVTLYGHADGPAGNTMDFLIVNTL